MPPAFFFFPPQDCFGNSGSFMVPYNFLDYPSSVKNVMGNLIGITLNLQIALGSFMIFLFIYLFIFGCVGSSFLCEGFLQLWQAGATPHRGAWASHHCGLSCCGAQAPDVQAQQPWLTGLVAPRHVGSSQTRARTRVPCISRQTLNHCATREAPQFRDF